MPLIQFGWDKELNRHTYLGEKSKEDVEARKVNDLYIVAKDIFDIKSVLNYQELIKAVMDALYVKERMAKNYIKYMKEHEIIERTQGDSVEFRLSPKLF